MYPENINNEEIIIQELSIDILSKKLFLTSLKKNIWQLFRNHILHYDVVMKLIDITDNNLDNLDNLDAILYIKETKTYKDCTDNQIEELKRNRLKKIVKPNMVNENMPWGIYYPKKMGKTEIIMNVFKVYTIGEGLGKKTGIECTSLKKDAQKNIFEQLRIPDADGTKIANCNIMVNDLLNKERLTMLPLYKPKPKL